MVYRGRVQQAIIFPRTGIQQVALFITPENALRPSNATIIIPGHRADFMNRALAIEACQQFVLIGELADSRLLNEQIVDQAQEALCHSLGTAVDMKQQEVPYELYLQVRRDITGSGYKLIIIGERTYNGIPFVGRVIKSGK